MTMMNKNLEMTMMKERAYELLNYAQQQPPLMPRLRNSEWKSPTYGARPIIMAPLNIGVGKYKVQTRNTENAKYKKNEFLEAATTGETIANYKSRKAHVAEIMLCEQLFAT